jgi:D-alanine-D-alanine ligase
MKIGIAYDLKSDYSNSTQASNPDDRLEEYDSTETVDGIASALQEIGWEPVRLGGGREFLRRLMAERVDLVFNISEGWGTRSREAQVPAVCELLRIPCTHSGPLALAISLDKAMTKRFAAFHGVQTPAFLCVDNMEQFDETPLPPFPLMAKPASEGSSIGIRMHSRCESGKELRDCVAWLLQEYGGVVLIERFLPGPEVTVLVMGTGESARVMGIMQIVPRAQREEAFVYSLEVKRDFRNLVDYHVPPCLPAATIAAIEETALRAYRAIDCRDIARVDIRLDEAGKASLIEVNPLPGLHPVDGDVPILCGRLGISYTGLIRMIVDEARSRA